ELLVTAARQLSARGIGMRWLSARGCSSEDIERSIRRCAMTGDERLARSRSPSYLFLDDAELLQGTRALTVLRELLESTHARTRVVVGSRVHLELGLARLRGRGELAELHGADLAFDRDETRRFLANLW